jgi:hypothetical protein
MWKKIIIEAIYIFPNYLEQVRNRTDIFEKKTYRHKLMLCYQIIDKTLSDSNVK